MHARKLQAAEASPSAAELATTVSGPGPLSSGAARAALMKFRQIRAGSLPPVTALIGVSSSLPTHTPTINGSVKPTNQASRWFWLVPVLPAASGSEIGFSTRPLLDDQPQ